MIKTVDQTPLFHLQSCDVDLNSAMVRVEMEDYPFKIFPDNKWQNIILSFKKRLTVKFMYIHINR